MTTHREIENAWWRWAAEQLVRKMAAADIVRTVGDKPFSFGGTDWVVRLHPVLSSSGKSFRFERHYVGADGRVLRPLKMPANRGR